MNGKRLTFHHLNYTTRLAFHHLNCYNGINFTSYKLLQWDVERKWCSHPAWTDTVQLLFMRAATVWFVKGCRSSGSNSVHSLFTTAATEYLTKGSASDSKWFLITKSRINNSFYKNKMLKKKLLNWEWSKREIWNRYSHKG